MTAAGDPPGGPGKLARLIGGDDEDERGTTEPDERMYLEAVGDSPNSPVLVAEHGRRLVGYVGASGAEFRRSRSTAMS
jgi:hypothetical protein